LREAKRGTFFTARLESSSSSSASPVAAACRARGEGCGGGCSRVHSSSKVNSGREWVWEPRGVPFHSKGGSCDLQLPTS
jgi:hypothetical protein